MSAQRPRGRRREDVGRSTTLRRLGVRAKSLIGIPWRYALACIDDLGLILRAEVIWSKPNGLPESVTDRVRRSHEQWFHFTLAPRYFSAVDEIREEHAAAGRRRRVARGQSLRWRSRPQQSDQTAQPTPSASSPAPSGPSRRIYGITSYLAGCTSVQGAEGT